MWTWDARPYPAWPYSTFWGDGNLWEKGHWVNNKFGTSNLASIILEISQKCGIDISNIDVSTVDEPIEGLFFNNQITALNAINTLRTSHFFDICANNKEFISFIKRGYKKERVLNSQNCLKLSDNSFVEIIDIPEELILGKIDLYFIDQNTEFESNYIYVNNETNSFITRAIVRLPLLITENQANNIAHLILKNAAIENRIIRFKLSSTDFALKPSDFVVFQHHKSKYSIRIIDTEIGHNHICVIGVIDARASYLQVLHSKDNINVNYSDSNTKLMILDLPFSFEETTTPYLGIYLRNNCNAPLYTKFPNELEDKWHNIANLKKSNAIGKVISFNHSDSANIFTIDRGSEIIISGIKLEKYISNNWQYASVGNELIGFKNLEKIDENLYKISSLTRGEMGTEEFMNHHEPSENFAIIVRSEINIIAVSKKLENKSVEFKSCNIEKPLTYTNKAQQTLAPYITRKTIANDSLHLEWVTRIKSNTCWESEAEILPTEFVITIKDGQQIHEQKTQQNYIIINIRELALSDDYQLSIITNYKY